MGVCVDRTDGNDQSPSYNLSMRRTDLLDTKEWAHRRMVLRARAMSPSDRAKLVSKLSAMGRDIHCLAEARRSASHKKVT